MGITAKELAKKLNLSEAAVSMALNKKPGVSTKTRSRVLDAAERYGYDFTRISDKPISPGAIHFIIYKKFGTVVTDSPFFSQLSEGVSEACKKYNYSLNISYFLEDEHSIQRQLEDIRHSNCSGIILLGTEMGDDNILAFLDIHLPIVLLDTYFEVVSCNYVHINNVQGAFLATKHLINKCRVQPGYLKSAYAIKNFDERAAGFYDAVRSVGMSASKCIVHQLSPSMEGAYSDMLQLVKNGEELAGSYFADNDLIALGAIKALTESGISVPEDISVIGFDNIPACSMLEPALSTVNVPKKYMGEAAVERLISIINTPGQPFVKTEISTSLVMRSSVRSGKIK